MNYCYINFILIFLISVTFMSEVSGQPNLIPLWPSNSDAVNTSKSEKTDPNRDILWIEHVQIPTIEVFLPVRRHSTGMALLVCPGGGYSGLAYDWEGTDIAKWLNTQGIAAFVLKYRLPRTTSEKDESTYALQDAQRALRLIRYHSNQWNINTDQVGVIGFSAGGHLASTLATQYDQKVFGSTEPVDALSARPDFVALIYPVITMNADFTHSGSRKNLIGPNPKKETIDLFSNELQVTHRTPPTFIVHSSDDKAVPVKNSLLFYEALRKANVSAEMHIYPEGGHGYSLAIGKGYLQNWTDRMADWLVSLQKRRP
ncbi:alpha/beta hydrolase [Fulvivirga sp. M361]|uniref:alpha/beta hydrolase n=1 Tax=Fulvivirga sp. M361 TaxID=2594266 RepID=UPI001179D7F2|nr:alpha/beta hydrolase [Fulvivirga sp. M361]TRX49043.1 alpha/beta hydrolase [Fulvivirga sp. M361]